VQGLAADHSRTFWTALVCTSQAYPADSWVATLGIQQMKNIRSRLQSDEGHERVVCERIPDPSSTSTPGGRSK